MQQRPYLNIDAFIWNQLDSRSFVLKQAPQKEEQYLNKKYIKHYVLLLFTKIISHSTFSFYNQIMARYQLVGQNKDMKRIFRSTLKIVAFTWIHAYDILEDGQSVDIWREKKVAELQFVSVTVGLTHTPHQFSLLEFFFFLLNWSYPEHAYRFNGGG